MNRKYSDLFEKGDVKLNPNKLFTELTVEDEVSITRELINYCIWANKNIAKIESFLNTQKISLYIDEGHNEVNTKILTEFWLQYIYKPNIIENLLNSLQIVTDCYDYIQNYFLKIVSFTIEEDFIMVSKKNIRSDKQATRLNNIMKTKYKTELEEILKKYKRNIDHIEKAYSDKLINYFVNKYNQERNICV